MLWCQLSEHRRLQLDRRLAQPAAAGGLAAQEVQRMAYTDSHSFASAVISDYRALRTLEGKSIELSRRTAESVAASRMTTGHPQFLELSLGQAGHCDAVAMFIDLENFTGRTYWDQPNDVVRLAQAVLGQIAEIILGYGGYILGLRGDGLFACFGPNKQDSKIDIGLAMSAGATVLDSAKNSLNWLLRQDGIEPIQLRVGADFGRLDFVRTGTERASEINVIGFAANFAAKCEKYANSWEFVAGQRLTEEVPAIAEWFTEHTKSPKYYQRNYDRRSYRFYDFFWTRILPYGENITAQLSGHPSTLVQTH